MTNTSRTMSKMLEETDDKKSIENIENVLETLKNAQSVMTSVLKFGYEPTIIKY